MNNEPYDNSIRRVIVAAKHRVGQIRQQQLEASTLVLQDSYRIAADELEQAINDIISQFPELTKGL